MREQGNSPKSSVFDVSIFGYTFVAVSFSTFSFFYTSQKMLTERTNRHWPDSSTIERLKNADYCIILTELEEFKKLTPESFTKSMK